MTETNKNTPHPHHKEMMQFAEDAAKRSDPWLLWECRVHNHSESVACLGIPSWNILNIYRRKPEMLTCNGVEFPAPERSVLSLGETYYYPGILSKSKANCVIWDGHHQDTLMLKMGFVHLLEEAAAQHAEALIAVSRIKED